MVTGINSIQDAYLKPHLKRLQALFAAMDREYAKAAAHYGFECSGCPDNCCQTRFYHHTYLEYLYLKQGFKTLGPEKKATVKSGAEAACRQSAAGDLPGRVRRRMCPLNFENRCILYRYRPMICRLHGIPHELHRDARRKVFGPGCATYDASCADKDYYQFDRTPFYIEMAGLENELRQATGMAAKIRLTIAEMLVRFDA